MTIHSTKLYSFGVVLAAIALLTGCSSASGAAPTTTAVQSAEVSITSKPLLDAVSNTVLDQLVSYPSATQAQVSSSIITIPPGVETGLHRHDAPMYAYILEGELSVTYDGGVSKTYRAGEAIMEAVGTAHNGKNIGEKPVKILVVNIGAEGISNTVPLP